MCYWSSLDIGPANELNITCYHITQYVYIGICMYIYIEYTYIYMLTKEKRNIP